jgi:hypothetical protein
MRKLLPILFFFGPLAVMAQQPKMYLKIYGGTNTTNYVYRQESVDTDHLIGWQVGGGFRVDQRSAFAEIDFSFVQSGINLSPREDDELPIEEPVNIIMRGFEIPISLGYVAVKTPVFKWFLYGGLVNRFSMKGRIEYLGEKITFKPKEAKLHFYNLAARFGTQADVAMFNFDFNYSIGITNGFRDPVRTNIHAFQLNVGYLF